MPKEDKHYNWSPVCDQYVFPFVFNNKTFKRCTWEEGIRPWCVTNGSLFYANGSYTDDSFNKIIQMTKGGEFAHMIVQLKVRSVQNANFPLNTKTLFILHVQTIIGSRLITIVKQFILKT